MSQSTIIKEDVKNVALRKRFKLFKRHECTRNLLKRIFESRLLKFIEFLYDYFDIFNFFDVGRITLLAAFVANMAINNGSIFEPGS